MEVAVPTRPDGNRSFQLPYKIVAFGGSAGAINALIQMKLTFSSYPSQEDLAIR